jgi:hypothetical protein
VLNVGLGSEIKIKQAHGLGANIFLTKPVKLARFIEIY